MGSAAPRRAGPVQGAGRWGAARGAAAVEAGAGRDGSAPWGRARVRPQGSGQSRRRALSGRHRKLRSWAQGVDAPLWGPRARSWKQRLPSSHAGRWRGEAAGTDQGLCWRRGVTPGWGPSGQVSERQNQLIDLLSGGGKAKASEDRAPLGPRPGEHTVSADARSRQTRVDDRWCGRGGVLPKLLQRVRSSSAMSPECLVGPGPSTWCREC